MSNKTWTEEDLRRAVDEFDEERTKVRVAVERGIDRRHMGEIDDLGQAALATFVGRIVEDLIAVFPDVERVMFFAEEYAAGLASDGLWSKVMAAVYIEGDMAGGELYRDGILGQAVDRAVEQILPYATRGPGGWYNHHAKLNTVNTA